MGVFPSKSDDSPLSLGTTEPLIINWLVDAYGVNIISNYTSKILSLKLADYSLQAIGKWHPGRANESNPFAFAAGKEKMDICPEVESL